MCSGEVIRLLKCGHEQIHLKTRCGQGCPKPAEPECFEINDTCYECTAGHKIFTARTYYNRYVAGTEAGRTVDNSHELDETFERLRLALDEEETKILKQSPTHEETPFLPHINMTDLDLSCEWVEGKCIWSDPPTNEPRTVRRIAGIYPAKQYCRSHSESNGLESLSSPHFGETTDYGDDDCEVDDDYEVDDDDDDDDGDEPRFSDPDGLMEPVDWLEIADQQTEPERGPPVPAHRPQGPRQMPTRLPSLLPPGMVDTASAEDRDSRPGQRSTFYTFRLLPYRREVYLAQARLSGRAATPTLTIPQDRRGEAAASSSSSPSEDSARPCEDGDETGRGDQGGTDQYDDALERWAKLKEALQEREAAAQLLRARAG